MSNHTHTGQDYKLHIILNKADQFRKIHDFARAYGSLCWNLSKVIQRKDLPRIYTMCLPTNFQAKASGDQSDEGRSLGQGLMDLEAAREEVVAEVLNAPKRRVDNEVSRLSDAVSVLQMHCQIIDDVSKRYRGSRLRARLMVATSAIASIAVPATMITLGNNIHIFRVLNTLSLPLFFFPNLILSLRCLLYLLSSITVDDQSH